MSKEIPKKPYLDQNGFSHLIDDDPTLQYKCPDCHKIIGEKNMFNFIKVYDDKKCPFCSCEID